MTVAFVALACGGVLLFPGAARAQQPSAGAPPPIRNRAEPQPSPAPKQKTITINNREVTADQIAEATILVYGSRGSLTQIRRNGVERGHLIRTGADGRSEEGTYERRFIRGDSAEKDKIRVDQKLPSAEYALVYGDGHIYGIINGAVFTPRQEAMADFASQQWHGLDALLRYKENGSTLTLVGKEKLQGIEMYVLDLTDKDKRQTRYYISAKTFHILRLEYSEPPGGSGTPVKYTRKFYDYRYAQQTLVPYRTVFFENDKPVEETRVSTVTYGIKMDDTLFQNTEAQNTQPGQPSQP